MRTRWEVGQVYTHTGSPSMGLWAVTHIGRMHRGVEAKEDMVWFSQLRRKGKRWTAGGPYMSIPVGMTAEQYGLKYGGRYISGS